MNVLLSERAILSVHLVSPLLPYVVYHQLGVMPIVEKLIIIVILAVDSISLRHTAGR